MTKPIDVDVWVRGENDARTVPATGVPADPSSWTDADVKSLLTEMLQALDRAGTRGASRRRSCCAASAGSSVRDRRACCCTSR